MTEEQLAKLYKLDLDDDRVMSLAMQLWDLGDYDEYLELDDPEQIEAKQQQVDQIAAMLTPCYNDGLIKLTERAISTSTKMLRFAMRLDQFCTKRAEEDLGLEIEQKIKCQYTKVLNEDPLLQQLLQGDAGIPEIMQTLLECQRNQTTHRCSLPNFIRRLREWFMHTQADTSVLGFDGALLRQFPELMFIYYERDYRQQFDQQFSNPTRYRLDELLQKLNDLYEWTKVKDNDDLIDYF